MFTNFAADGSQKNSFETCINPKSQWLAFATDFRFTRCVNRRNFGNLFSTRVWIGLLLCLILAANLAIRWHLRDLPLERDEGEYAYAGQLILQGIPPYQIAWNMKFPGTYFAYAALMSVFGETPQGIHLGLILVTSLSIALVFLIGRELMGAVGGLLAAIFFTGLSALPFAFGLAAHATHFVVLFVCLGTFALLKMEKKKPFLWTAISGLAFGCAILMKQHAAIFAAAAFAWLAWRMFLKKEKAISVATIFAVTAAIPLLLTAIGLAWAGVWDRFNLWTIQYAREYVSIFPLRAVPRQFINGFDPILDNGVWVWVFGLMGITLVFLKIKFRRAAIFGTGLLLAGLAATVPGFYFRGHYFLMVMPGIALLNAALLLALADWIKKSSQVQMLKLIPACLFLVVIGDLMVRNAAVWFQMTPAQISRKIYGLSPFPESPEIARYLAAHTKPDETIAMLGSEPQIFFLAQRHSASGYIYVYPLTEPQPLAANMRAEFIHEIETAKPKYIVYVNTLSSWCSAVMPDETQKILDSLNDWWNAYALQNYQQVGAVDTAEDQPSQFFWDEQLVNRTNTAFPAISVFRRK